MSVGPGEETLRVKSSPGFAYSISRINPLYFESELKHLEEIKRDKSGALDGKQPAGNIEKEAKTATPLLHRHFRRSQSLPPRLGEQRQRRKYNWLGINVIHIQRASVADESTRTSGITAYNSSRILDNLSLHRASSSTAAIITNPTFVKSICFVPETMEYSLPTELSTNKTRQHVMAVTEDKSDVTMHKDSLVHCSANINSEEATETDSIVSDSLLEMTSLQPRRTSEILKSETQLQLPLAKHSCLKSTKGHEVLKEFSEAMAQSDRVARVQRANCELNSQDIQTSAELDAFSETGKCSPPHETSSPLSLVIKMLSGQRSVRGDHDNIALQIDEDCPVSSHDTGRRKSWFQRLSSLKKRQTESGSSSRSGSPDPFGGLENADLRDIFIHNVNTDILSGLQRADTPHDAVDPESHRKSTRRASSTRRQVSFSAETQEDGEVSLTPAHDNLSEETVPMSVETLVQLLSEAKSDDTEKESIWKRFYSSQLSAAQLEDRKMLRKWQATRHAKDRNLSIFTLDVGRAASLKRRTQEQKKVRKVCRVVTIVLVVGLFIGIIVLVSWLGSGGRKVFGSL